MEKVSYPDDCGNAPKKRFLRDLSIAMAEHDVDAIRAMTTDDIQWRRLGAGESAVQGHDALIAALRAGQEATALTLHTVITHGDTAAVDGVIMLENGESYAFCDVYRFRGASKTAKVKEITSYVIKKAS